jgi:tRNA threonylcarbamoyladenosine biosynthesis protein TsaE
MESIYSLEDIENVAKEFIETIKHNKVFAFNGNMGAGKTTFIKAVCHQLGVTENVSSPTFSIINQYQTKSKKNIFHIDLYRVKDLEEAINAGVEESIYSSDTCFIEWPEKVSSILPSGTVNVFIETVGETTRKLVVKLPESKFIINS